MTVRRKLVDFGRSNSRSADFFTNHEGLDVTNGVFVSLLSDVYVAFSRILTDKFADIAIGFACSALP